MARVRVHPHLTQGDWVTHRELGGRCLVVDVRGGVATVAWRTVVRLSRAQVEVRDCEADYPASRLTRV